MKVNAIFYLAPVVLALGCGGNADARKAAAEQKARDAEADYRSRLAAHEKMLRTGPNCRCPNPKCRRPLRITDVQAKRTVQCKACLARFSGRQARMDWPQITPPAPPSSPKPGGLRRLIGGIFG